MLLELCVTELEDVATDSEAGRSTAKPVVQESPHPYTDDSSQTGVVRIPGAESLRIEFNRNCSTERRHDPLTIMDSTGRTIATRSGSLALQIAGMAGLGTNWVRLAPNRANLGLLKSISVANLPNLGLTLTSLVI